MEPLIEATVRGLLILHYAIPIVIFIVGVAVMMKKINPARPVWAYICLSIIPFWLYFCPIGVMYLFSFAIEGTLLVKIVNELIGILYVFEFFLIPYLVVQIIRSSAAPLQNNTDSAPNIGKIRNARQQMHYGIYSTIVFNIVCILPACLYFYLLARGIIDAGAIVTSTPTDSPFALIGVYILASLLLLWSPLGWILADFLVMLTGFFACIAAISMIISLSFSLNGAIRFWRNEKPFHKRYILYVIMLFFPLLNIIAMIRLCGKSKKAIAVNTQYSQRT